MKNGRIPIDSRLFTTLFFLSGAAGLIYEILWMRKFSLFFGSDIYSSSIVLAVFMGGLAFGGYIASRIADKTDYPIAWYALLEIAVGIYAIFFERLLTIFMPFIGAAYLKLYQQYPLSYHLIRIAVAVFLLIIPTVMMGATLPLILKAFTKNMHALGKVTGHFYAINTIGALCGVFFSGFILMPRLGFNVMNLIAASLNIGVGIMALLFFTFDNKRTIPIFQDYEIKEKGSSDITGVIRRKSVLIAIAVSGFGSLALEVIWTRMLIRSFSATVYSFSTMLIGFLLGIALGSKFIARYLNSSNSAVKILAGIEIALGLSVAALTSLSLLIPSLFGALVWGMTNISSRLFGLASVAGALFISALFILPSTILFGAAFPAAIKAYNKGMRTTAKDSGRVIFSNTTGAVIGSLTAGFLLIPAFGSKISMLLLSVILFLNGLYVFKRNMHITGPLLNTRRMVYTGITLIFLIAVPVSMPDRTILNYNAQNNTRPNVIYHSEGIWGIVDVIKNQNGSMILSIDGNIEADTSIVQRRHFILKAHLPLLSLPSNPKEVLIVGLGLGITASSVAKHADVKRIDIIELLPPVIESQKYLKMVNGDILSDPRVNIRIDDGRNYLKFTKKKYDMITADPIHPRISGVGVLYTKEYYELIYGRLKDGGAVLQWMPIYSLSERSFEVALRAMWEVFPNTSVWYVPGHILLLGNKDRKPVFDHEILERAFKNTEIAKDLETIGIYDAKELLRLEIIPQEKLRSFLNRNNKEKHFVNTEDMPYLEYNAPFEFLVSPEENLKALAPYMGPDDSVVENAPAGFSEMLQKMQRDYIKELTK